MGMGMHVNRREMDPLANTRYFDDKISGYNSLINHTNCQRIEGPPLCGAFRMSVRPFEPFRSTLHPPFVIPRFVLVLLRIEVPTVEEWYCGDSGRMVCLIATVEELLFVLAVWQLSDVAKMCKRKIGDSEPRWDVHPSSPREERVLAPIPHDVMNGRGS
ncbi:hypothetical protein CDAR_443631 [Caerostris darwini]|uniref:Uncharacterized protein n=1 Tax=Caerostris darwini TaxID=1538125 RepID=A0AAV4TQB6_9ARAC|nr:hypothetical protein CDAR_443631 [Caerostris darwini]